MADHVSMTSRLSPTTPDMWNSALNPALSPLLSSNPSQAAIEHHNNNDCNASANSALVASLMSRTGGAQAGAEAAASSAGAPESSVEAGVSSFAVVVAPEIDAQSYSIATASPPRLLPIYSYASLQPTSSYSLQHLQPQQSGSLHQHLLPQARQQSSRGMSTLLEDTVSSTGVSETRPRRFSGASLRGTSRGASPALWPASSSSPSTTLRDAVACASAGSHASVESAKRRRRHPANRPVPHSSAIEQSHRVTTTGAAAAGVATLSSRDNIDSTSPQLLSPYLNESLHNAMNDGSADNNAADSNECSSSIGFSIGGAAAATAPFPGARATSSRYISEPSSHLLPHAPPKRQGSDNAGSNRDGEGCFLYSVGYSGSSGAVTPVPLDSWQSPSMATPASASTSALAAAAAAAAAAAEATVNHAGGPLGSHDDGSSACGNYDGELTSSSSHVGEHTPSTANARTATTTHQQSRRFDLPQLNTSLIHKPVNTPVVTTNIANTRTSRAAPLTRLAGNTNSSNISSSSNVKDGVSTPAPLKTSLPAVLLTEGHRHDGSVNEASQLSELMSNSHASYSQNSSHGGGGGSVSAASTSKGGTMLKWNRTTNAQRLNLRDLQPTSASEPEQQQQQQQQQHLQRQHQSATSPQRRATHMWNPRTPRLSLPATNTSLLSTPYATDRSSNMAGSLSTQQQAGSNRKNNNSTTGSLCTPRALRGSLNSADTPPTESTTSATANFGEPSFTSATSATVTAPHTTRRFILRRAAPHADAPQPSRADATKVGKPRVPLSTFDKHQHQQQQQQQQELAETSLSKTTHSASISATLASSPRSSAGMPSSQRRQRYAQYTGAPQSPPSPSHLVQQAESSPGTVEFTRVNQSPAVPVLCSKRKEEEVVVGATASALAPSSSSAAAARNSSHVASAKRQLKLRALVQSRSALQADGGPPSASTASSFGSAMPLQQAQASSIPSQLLSPSQRLQPVITPRAHPRRSLTSTSMNFSITGLAASTGNAVAVNTTVATASHFSHTAQLVTPLQTSTSSLQASHRAAPLSPIVILMSGDSMEGAITRVTTTAKTTSAGTAAKPAAALRASRPRFLPQFSRQVRVTRHRTSTAAAAAAKTTSHEVDSLKQQQQGSEKKDADEEVASSAAHEHLRGGARTSKGSQLDAVKPTVRVKGAASISARGRPPRPHPPMTSSSPSDHFLSTSPSLNTIVIHANGVQAPPPSEGKDGAGAAVTSEAKAGLENPCAMSATLSSATIMNSTSSILLQVQSSSTQYDNSVAPVQIVEEEEGAKTVDRAASVTELESQKVVIRRGAPNGSGKAKAKVEGRATTTTTAPSPLPVPRDTSASLEEVTCPPPLRETEKQKQQQQRLGKTSSVPVLVSQLVEAHGIEDKKRLVNAAAKLKVEHEVHALVSGHSRSNDDDTATANAAAASSTLPPTPSVVVEAVDVLATETRAAHPHKAVVESVLDASPVCQDDSAVPHTPCQRPIAEAVGEKEAKAKARLPPPVVASDPQQQQAQPSDSKDHMLTPAIISASPQRLRKADDSVSFLCVAVPSINEESAKAIKDNVDDNSSSSSCVTRPDEASKTSARGVDVTADVRAGEARTSDHGQPEAAAAAAAADATERKSSASGAETITKSKAEAQSFITPAAAAVAATTTASASHAKKSSAHSPHRDSKPPFRPPALSQDMVEGAAPKASSPSRNVTVAASTVSDRTDVVPVSADGVLLPSPPPPPSQLKLQTLQQQQQLPHPATTTATNPAAVLTMPAATTCYEHSALYSFFASGRIDGPLLLPPPTTTAITAAAATGGANHASPLYSSVTRTSAIRDDATGATHATFLTHGSSSSRFVTASLNGGAGCTATCSSSSPMTRLTTLLFTYSTASPTELLNAREAGNDSCRSLSQTGQPSPLQPSSTAAAASMEDVAVVGMKSVDGAPGQLTSSNQPMESLSPQLPQHQQQHKQSSQDTYISSFVPPRTPLLLQPAVLTAAAAASANALYPLAKRKWTSAVAVETPAALSRRGSLFKSLDEAEAVQRKDAAKAAEEKPAATQVRATAASAVATTTTNATARTTDTSAAEAADGAAALAAAAAMAADAASEPPLLRTLNEKEIGQLWMDICASTPKHIDRHRHSRRGFPSRQRPASSQVTPSDANRHGSHSNWSSIPDCIGPRRSLRKSPLWAAHHLTPTITTAASPTAGTTTSTSLAGAAAAVRSNSMDPTNSSSNTTGNSLSRDITHLSFPSVVAMMNSDDDEADAHGGGSGHAVHDGFLFHACDQDMEEILQAKAEVMQRIGRRPSISKLPSRRASASAHIGREKGDAVVRPCLQPISSFAHKRCGERRPPGKNGGGVNRHARQGSTGTAAVVDDVGLPTTLREYSEVVSQLRRAHSSANKSYADDAPADAPRRYPFHSPTLSLQSALLLSTDGGSESDESVDTFTSHSRAVGGVGATASSTSSGAVPAGLRDRALQSPGSGIMRGGVRLRGTGQPSTTHISLSKAADIANTNDEAAEVDGASNSKHGNCNPQRTSPPLQPQLKPQQHWRVWPSVLLSSTDEDYANDCVSAKSDGLPRGEDDNDNDENTIISTAAPATAGTTTTRTSSGAAPQLPRGTIPRRTSVVKPEKGGASPVLSLPTQAKNRPTPLAVDTLTTTTAATTTATTPTPTTNTNTAAPTPASPWPPSPSTPQRNAEAKAGMVAGRTGDARSSKESPKQACRLLTTQRPGGERSGSDDVAAAASTREKGRRGEGGVVVGACDEDNANNDDGGVARGAGILRMRSVLSESLTTVTSDPVTSQVDAAAAPTDIGGDVSFVYHPLTLDELAGHTATPLQGTAVNRSALMSRSGFNSTLLSPAESNFGTAAAAAREAEVSRGASVEEQLAVAVIDHASQPRSSSSRQRSSTEHDPLGGHLSESDTVSIARDKVAPPVVHVTQVQTERLSVDGRHAAQATAMQQQQPTTSAASAAVNAGTSPQPAVLLGAPTRLTETASADLVAPHEDAAFCFTPKCVLSAVSSITTPPEHDSNCSKEEKDKDDEQGSNRRATNTDSDDSSSDVLSTTNLQPWVSPFAPGANASATAIVLPTLNGHASPSAGPSILIPSRKWHGGSAMTTPAPTPYMPLASAEVDKGGRNEGGAAGTMESCPTIDASVTAAVVPLKLEASTPGSTEVTAVSAAAVEPVAPRRALRRSRVSCTPLSVDVVPSKNAKKQEGGAETATAGGLGMAAAAHMSPHPPSSPRPPSIASLAVVGRSIVPNRRSGPVGGHSCGGAEEGFAASLSRRDGARSPDSLHAQPSTLLSSSSSHHRQRVSFCGEVAEKSAPCPPPRLLEGSQLITVQAAAALASSSSRPTILSRSMQRGGTASASPVASPAGVNAPLSPHVSSFMSQRPPPIRVPVVAKTADATESLDILTGHAPTHTATTRSNSSSSSNIAHRGGNNNHDASNEYNRESAAEEGQTIMQQWTRQPTRQPPQQQQRPLSPSSLVRHASPLPENTEQGPPNSTHDSPAFHVYMQSTQDQTHSPLRNHRSGPTPMRSSPATSTPIAVAATATTTTTTNSDMPHKHDSGDHRVNTSTGVNGPEPMLPSDAGILPTHVLESNLNAAAVSHAEPPSLVILPDVTTVPGLEGERDSSAGSEVTSEKLLTRHQMPFSSRRLVTRSSSAGRLHNYDWAGSVVGSVMTVESSSLLSSPADSDIG